MAGKIVTAILDSVHGVTLRARHVLVCLGDHCNRNDDGIAYPSQETLSRRTGIGERRVRDALRELQDTGWITNVGTMKGKRGAVVKYRLNLSRMMEGIKQQKAATGGRQSAATIGGDRVPGFDDTKAADSQSKPGGFEAIPGGFDPQTRRPGADEPLNRNIEPILNHARAREPKTENQSTEIPTANDNPARRTPIPKAPRRGDQSAIENAARAMGLWPLQGEAGRDWGVAHTLVVQTIANRHRGEL